MASLGGILMVSVVRSAMPSVAERPGMAADQDADQRRAERQQDRPQLQKGAERACERARPSIAEAPGQGSRTRKSSWKIIVIDEARAGAHRERDEEVRAQRAFAAALDELEQEDVQEKKERRRCPERRAAADQPQCEAEAERQRKRDAGGEDRRLRAAPAAAVRAGAQRAQRHQRAAQRDHRAEHARHQAGRGIGIDAEVFEPVHRPRAVDDGRSHGDPADAGRKLVARKRLAIQGSAGARSA